MKKINGSTLLLIFAGILDVIIFAIILNVGYHSQMNTYIKSEQDKFAVEAEKCNEQLSNWFTSNSELADKIANDLVYLSFNSAEEYIQYLKHLQTQNEGIAAVYLCKDNNETYLDNWTVPSDYDPTSSDWYQTGMNAGGNVVFTEPYIDIITNDLTISVLKKVTTKDGINGVVGIDLPINEIKAMVDSVNDTQNGSAYLLSPSGNIITHSNSDFLPKVVNNQGVFTNINDINISNITPITLDIDTPVTLSELTDYDLVSKYNAEFTIDGVNWKVGINVPLDSYLTGKRQVMYSLIPFICLGLIVALYAIFLTVVLLRKFSNKVTWFYSILDSIPMPISVTDSNMNWTLVNKPVMDMFSKPRSYFIGKHCSTWGAPICNTEKCGVTCLRNNVPETLFDMMGGNFKVNSSYLTDKKGHRIGHIEVVSDISSLQKITNEQKIIINEVETATDEFVEFSNQIASSAQSLAQASNEQALLIEQLSGSLSDISLKLEDTATNAERGKNAGLESVAIVKKGSSLMNELSSAMNEISNSSDQIEKIIKTIDEIAFQTNILALNAAVEAARAGVHGKGFAVVAEEVRNLAGKSAEAAKDTTTLIANSINAIENGTKITSETIKAFTEIQSGCENTSALANEIATVIGEQNKTVLDVVEGIKQISVAVTSNSSISQESAATSEELTSKAHTLRDIVLKN